MQERPVYVHDCRKQTCHGCSERGHHIIKYGKAENVVMTVNMLGRKSKDDDSPVCSEAKVEAHTTLEIKTGDSLVSMMDEGEIGQMGDDL